MNKEKDIDYKSIDYKIPAIVRQGYTTMFRTHAGTSFKEKVLFTIKQSIISAILALSVISISIVLYGVETIYAYCFVGLICAFSLFRIFKMWRKSSKPKKMLELVKLSDLNLNSNN